MGWVELSWEQASAYLNRFYAATSCCLFRGVPGPPWYAVLAQALLAQAVRLLSGVVVSGVSRLGLSFGEAFSHADGAGWECVSDRGSRHISTVRPSTKNNEAGGTRPGCGASWLIPLLYSPPVLRRLTG